MPNKNYEKGRRKEYKICNNFRTRGFITFRSAGSHSPIDVVAISTEKRQIILIQAKSGGFTEKERDNLTKKHESLNGIFEVTFKVI